MNDFIPYWIKILAKSHHAKKSPDSFQLNSKDFERNISEHHRLLVEELTQHVSLLNSQVGNYPGVELLFDNWSVYGYHTCVSAHLGKTRALLTFCPKALNISFSILKGFELTQIEQLNFELRWNSLSLTSLYFTKSKDFQGLTIFAIVHYILVRMFQIEYGTNNNRSKSPPHTKESINGNQLPK